MLKKSSTLLAPSIITVDLIKVDYLPLERDIFEHFFHSRKFLDNNILHFYVLLCSQ